MSTFILSFDDCDKNAKAVSVALGNSQLSESKTNTCLHYLEGDHNLINSSFIIEENIK